MKSRYDQCLAAAALIMLAVFLAIIAWRVEEWDLRLVLFIAVAMVTYDFWRSCFSKPSKARQNRARSNGAHQ